MPRKAVALSLEPVDGRFVHSPEDRKTACVKAGHPLIYLNVSKSTAECRIMRCLCGEIAKRIEEPKNAA